METTAHYGLTQLDPGESFSANDYAFTQRNISDIDAKLYLGAEAHKHTGAGPAVTDPVSPPAVTLISGSGSIPAGRTVRYKFTWVDPNGQETAPSPEITVNTPNPITVPARPGLVSAQAGGFLMPGNYYYAFSAYKTSSTMETAVGDRAYCTLSQATSTNLVTLDLPTLPSGATGFNLYRRSPGETTFHFLATIDMTGGTPPTTFLDNGTITENCNRSAPSVNTTGGSNQVVVTIPGATPVVPAGYTWKLYRTYVSGDYSSSLLHWVVEQTSEESGIITPTYTDLGSSTTEGSPPLVTEITGSPSKVDLHNVEEVTGYLPTGRNVLPLILNFSSSGPVVVSTGSFLWVNEYDNFQIMRVRASLGVDAAPSVHPVIADVQMYDADAETWDSVFADPSRKPNVPVGDMIGPSIDLDPIADVVVIPKGNALRVDISQAGGGGTPTDYNLMVTLVCYAKVNDDAFTHVWGA